MFDTCLLNPNSFISGGHAARSQLGFDYVDVPHNVEFDYEEILKNIQMVDTLLLIMCIYFGFARKQTVCVTITSDRNGLDEALCLVFVLANVVLQYV